MTLRLIHSARHTVERVAEARLPTETGEFRIIGFRSLISTEEFVALVKGDLRAGRPSLIRIHSQCMTGDVFGSVKCDCGRQLEAAMKLIEHAGHGAIVYQQQEGRGIGIINKISAYALQDQGADTIEANERLGFAADMRSYEQCAEILLDLGLRAVRVMSDNPAKIQALRQPDSKSSSACLSKLNRTMRSSITSRPRRRRWATSSAWRENLCHTEAQKHKVSFVPFVLFVA